MKPSPRHLSLKAQASWNHQLEDKPRYLDGLTPITSASVILQNQKIAKPEFRVRVWMEVPEPGEHAIDTRHKRQILLFLRGRTLRANSIGDTLQGALLKVNEHLEQQAKDRQLRRTERGKSPLLLSCVNTQGD
jgi:ribosome-associated translation inhibitor RaiA